MAEEKDSGEWNKHWEGTSESRFHCHFGTWLPKNQDNLELCSIQPTQMYVAALPMTTNSTVPEACLTQPCPFSWSEAQYPWAWTNQYLKNEHHPCLGHKYFSGLFQMAKQMVWHLKLPIFMKLRVRSQFCITSHI